MDPDADMTLEKCSLEYLCTFSQVVLLILDKSGNILSANQYATTITGLHLEGKHLRDIILVGSWQEDLLETWAMQQTQPLMNISTGDDLPITLYITVFSKDSGYVLFGHRDSGELQRLSREILALNQDLSILSRELHIRNTELAELNRLKNQFLGMASHDLRNPVGIILSYSDFLIEDLAGELSPDHLKFLNNIHSAAEDMKQVINDFLDVSIIESGHLSLNYEETEPGALIQEVLQKVILSADRRKIFFQTVPDPLITRIRVDNRKIEQVLLNLIKNAIEYSPDGGLVTVSVAHGNDGIVFRIQDQGKGITKEKQEALFQEFSGTSKRKKDGERSIGLGLVISRKIVEAHGGKMFIESELEKGSTFGFILPISCLLPHTPVLSGDHQPDDSRIHLESKT